MRITDNGSNPTTTYRFLPSTCVPDRTNNFLGGVSIKQIRNLTQTKKVSKVVEKDSPECLMAAVTSKESMSITKDVLPPHQTLEWRQLPFQTVCGPAKMSIELYHVLNLKSLQSAVENIYHQFKIIYCHTVLPAVEFQLVPTATNRWMASLLFMR